MMCLWCYYDVMRWFVMYMMWFVMFMMCFSLKWIKRFSKSFSPMWSLDITTYHFTAGDTLLGMCHKNIKNRSCITLKTSLKVIKTCVCRTLHFQFLIFMNTNAATYLEVCHTTSVKMCVLWHKNLFYIINSVENECFMAWKPVFII